MVVHRYFSTNLLALIYLFYHKLNNIINEIV